MSEISFTKYSSMLLKYGVDLLNREIILSGDITSKSRLKFYKLMKILEVNKEPITISINSLGGSIEEQFSIIDIINSSPCDITTIGTGRIMSAALSILASGKYRQATKYAQFMHHGLNSTNPTTMTVPHSEVDLKYSKELDRLRFKFLAEHSKKPYSFWASTGKHTDFYFNSEKALEFGLIDEII